MRCLYLLFIVLWMAFMPKEEAASKLAALHPLNTFRLTNLSIPKYNTTQFGLKCIYKKCINSWNNLTSEINKNEKSKFVNKMKSTDIDFSKLSKSKLKDTITTHILSKYDD